MSDYDYDMDGFDESDQKPTRQKTANSKQSVNTDDQKNVRFKLGGTIGSTFDNMNKDLKGAKTAPNDKVKFEDLPRDVKKAQQQDDLERKKANLTIDDIVSDSKSNKHVIYKFMKKGFTALSAEELACTMVNPTFSVDFKRNTKEDWNANYQAKVVDKLQRCKFHMHWFNKQASASGYDDQHEGLFKLIEIGDLDKVFMYLRKNDMQQVLQAVEQKSKRSPLHVATKFGHLHLVEFFLNKGSNIEARDKLLKTPLHYACETGNMLVVKMLMDNGADPFDRDNCGRTALHYAVYSGRTEIMALLTQHTTDIVHMKDHAGRTALHHAVFMEANQVLMISKLLDFGADVNALDSDKRTALHHAAEGNKPRVIPILIQRGAHTSLKDSLLKKTPLEMAANDHIKELMIAYCSPNYMPDENELNKVPSSKKRIDTRVNKNGSISHPVDFDLEPPLRDQGILKPKSLKKKAAPQTELVQERVIVKEVIQEPAGVVCINCQNVKGLGPASEWEKQNDQFIPYNMRNYQERLVQLLRRIQNFGVESFVFQKKPYLYTGSWMEYVRNLDDLMLQINGVNPNEACMKIFNVLFPYPKPLPLGKGDESSLAGFFDGVTNINKNREARDCLPEQLMENIANKKQDVVEEAMEKNNLETVQDLLDIRQEVMQLRSANNALEFAIQQKDELIAQLKGDSDKLARDLSEQQSTDAQNVKLMATNTKLQRQLESMIEKNTELENKIIELNNAVRNAESSVNDSHANELTSKMADQIEQLIEQNEKLKQKYQLINEKNKSLRHTAGQVFLQSLESGASLNKASIKSEGAGKLYLEDEEAVIRMLKEIDLQQKGDLKVRLKNVSFKDSGMMWKKHFIGLIKDELGMNDADQIRLLRVSGFAALKTEDKSLKWELVLKNIEERIANSAKLKDDCIKKVAKLMIDAGLTLESAMLYMDTDNSGSITRFEFSEAFKEMKVSLNESLIKNIFVILDKNGDNQIDLIEFETIFSKYMNRGGPVREVAAEELEKEITGVDKQTAKDLAKQMNNEIKKVNTYSDERLESQSDDKLAELEEQRVMDIKAGSIPEKIIGGELVLKITQGQNFVQLNGLNKFALAYEMPRYDNSGKLMQSSSYNQLKMQDAETGAFKIKLKLPIMNHNMFLYQEIIRVHVYKIAEEETDFKTNNKKYIGCFYVMWKECVEREQDGQSPWLQFSEELRDPEGKCTVDLSGMFSGQLKWIKFGHADSSYNSKGERVGAPAIQKSAADTRGKQVGAAGSLKVQPWGYTSPEDLSMDINYQVKFELRNKAGDLVADTLCEPTVSGLQEPKQLKWSNYKELAVSDTNEDVLLVLTFMTEQSGITKGREISRGQINLQEALYNKELNQRGQQRIRFKLSMDLIEGSGEAQLDVQLIMEKPKPAQPTEEPADPEPKKEDSKEETSKQENYAIPNDDDEREDDEEEENGNGNDEEDDEDL